LNVEKFDLPEESYPFTIIVHGKDGELLFRQVVSGPGVMQVPGFPEHAPCKVTMQFPDGEVFSS
jgi:hypothetical protein